MKFRTEVRVSPFLFSINHFNPILLLGSCFSSNIGDRLQAYRFKTGVNPHGIVFNPISLEKVVLSSIYNEEPNCDFYLEQDGIWKCFLYHSELYAKSKKQLAQKITDSNLVLQQAILKASVVFVTLGTAWVYRLKSSNQIVSNCHKVPQNQFCKELLSVGAINESIQNLAKHIKAVNPKCNIVFTISPVRHTKNGMVENQVSKSRLISAVYELVNKEQHCHYFPSYEMVIDDLRDYRYFEKDLIHPNEQAIDYIWEQFENTFFDIKTKDLNRLIHKLNLALAHRLLSSSKQQIEIFQNSSLELCKQIQSQVDINLDKEIKYFKSLRQ